MLPLEHACGGFFNLLPQGLVQAVTRHDIGLMTENVSIEPRSDVEQDLSQGPGRPR